MKKLVKSSKEVRDKLRSGLELISAPVIQTLSPLGRNTIFEDDNGMIALTNDGVTIAKNIQSSDPIENAIIEMVKHGAMKTNSVAGDGTTSSILYTATLVTEGWKQLDDGVNPMELKTTLEEVADTLVSNLDPIKIQSDDDIEAVARISANNDYDIANNVLEIVTTAGVDGMVLIEDSKTEKTEIEKNVGFIIDSGIFAQEYAQGGFVAKFDECHVFVTDKRIYYKEEVETIIRTAIESGIKNLVVVAKDFIGKAVNSFSNNQVNNDRISLLLVKNTDETSLSDLAIYLGGKIISDKHGRIVNNITSSDFLHAKSVFSNTVRTVITPLISANDELTKLVAVLKEQKEKNEEDKIIGARLASLTSGMVTIKVGGSTPIEVREKIFRYEDAINATRSAMKHGYLPGGGIGIMMAYNKSTFSDGAKSIARKLSEASIRQIATNCGKHEEYILENCSPSKGIGYDAKNNKFVEMIGAGIVDSYKVVEMAIKNSVSIANSILTAGYLIVNDIEKNDKLDTRCYGVEGSVG